MSTNHNRIKVADLETNQPNKILSTNSSGELEFRDINSIKTDSYNGLDYSEEGKALDARQGKVLKGLIDNIKDTLKTYFDTIYLGISNDQNVLGIKTFLNGTLGIRNAANTFTSFFTNSNTTSRTYTLQNRNGTLLDNTDLSTINSSLATKQSVFTGITNYIPKSLSATTLGSSRLIDNGISFGIGTSKIPTKDITLGNQSTKEIGIEQSTNQSSGADLTISAGRTINYGIDNDFVSLNNPKATNYGMAVDLHGNLYFVGNQIWIRYFDTSIFVNVGLLGTQAAHGGICFTPSGTSYIGSSNGNVYRRLVGESTYSVFASNLGDIRGLACAPNGDVYLANRTQIYKMVSGTDVFLSCNQTIRSWWGLCVSPNGDVYCCEDWGNVYIQINGSTTFVPVASGNFRSMCASPNGDIYGATEFGLIYKRTSGSGPFILQNAPTGGWRAMAADAKGNIYAGLSNGEIYVQINDNLGAPDLHGGALNFKAGSGKGIGQSRINFITGQKTTSGTDMQIETVRAYIDENGYMIWAKMPTYPDNASAIAGGLPIGCEYKTSNGDRRIVY
ncbi:hypothetical protein [Flavobacterium sp. UBA4854]|uniref:hypothetical protein n=1 Tax=Flavobacterium sp. UBA4854 TaxID=1946548 RepID=UPI00257A4375|nr:hypothetical protein [Flavobacterium sp. UBA4854]